MRRVVTGRDSGMGSAMEIRMGMEAKNKKERREEIQGEKEIEMVEIGR